MAQGTSQVPAKVVKESFLAGAKAKTLELAERGKKSALENAEKAVKRLKGDIKKAEGQANIPQIALTAGTAVLAGMAGFKTQKALTDTTKAWVIEAGQDVPAEDVGKPTTAAVLMKDVLPPTFGVLVALGGVLWGNSIVGPALAGAGFGFAGGSITSSALDPTP